MRMNEPLFHLPHCAFAFPLAFSPSLENYPSLLDSVHHARRRSCPLSLAKPCPARLDPHACTPGTARRPHLNPVEEYHFCPSLFTSFFCFARLKELIETLLQRISVLLRSAHCGFRKIPRKQVVFLCRINTKRGCENQSEIKKRNLQVLDFHPTPARHVGTNRPSWQRKRPWTPRDRRRNAGRIWRRRLANEPFSFSRAFGRR